MTERVVALLVIVATGIGAGDRGGGGRDGGDSIHVGRGRGGSNGARGSDAVSRGGRVIVENDDARVTVAGSTSTAPAPPTGQNRRSILRKPYQEKHKYRDVLSHSDSEIICLMILSQDYHSTKLIYIHTHNTLEQESDTLYETRILM